MTSLEEERSMRRQEESEHKRQHKWKHTTTEPRSKYELPGNIATPLTDEQLAKLPIETHIEQRRIDERVIECLHSQLEESYKIINKQMKEIEELKNGNGNE